MVAWANPAVSYIGVLSASEENLIKMRDAGYSVEQCIDALAICPPSHRGRELVRKEIVAIENSARRRIQRARLALSA
jgi:hypothetical protein